MNGIAPGYIDTKMTNEFIHSDRGKMCLERIPLHRWGQPSDVGNVASFLMSDAANYINGAVITVDGGYINT